jgi:hypothetical protein
MADAAVEVVEPDRHGDHVARHAGEVAVVHALEHLARDGPGDRLRFGRQLGRWRDRRVGRTEGGGDRGRGRLPVGGARGQVEGERGRRRAPEEGTTGQPALPGDVVRVHRSFRRAALLGPLAGPELYRRASETGTPGRRPPGAAPDGWDGGAPRG